MLEFKKYNSIENSFNKEFMEYVVAEMPPDLQYVVQEKVHGTNTSFLCDGHNVQFAKRTSILGEDEKFYDYPELLESYRERILKLFAKVKDRYPDMTSVSVFGEMFGGIYPHNEVKRIGKLTVIQKGVFYTPVHEFYGFDIFIFSENGARFLSVAEANELFESGGFFYAKTLFEGTLPECLMYPNIFQSYIAQWLGLPDIDDNICEGIVIRPIVPMYLRNGSRVLIKSKNEKFAEKKNVKKRLKIDVEQPEYSEELKTLLLEVDVYVTENRLANVVSHIGEVHVPKDFGKMMGLLAKDALEDFLKEFDDGYSNLDKLEQKILNKELNRLSTELVKSVYMKQAYIFE